MNYTLADLIDIPQLQELMDTFLVSNITPTAILDADGTILTASGWQDICTKFHRACPRSEALCRQSDAFITQNLGQGKKYVAYECANGLVDVAHPIIVEGNHLGTVFAGQFLYEKPQLERFQGQAQEFGFDETAYLKALAQVPIISYEKIEPTLQYLAIFTQVLANAGLERLKLIRMQEAFHNISVRKQAEEEREIFQAQMIEVQRKTLREIGTPLIPLAEGVVVMPLIGTFDAERAQQMLETLLEGVANHQAKIAILDVTGVPALDNRTANDILQATQAVRLLGAQMILTGIRANLAQTLIQLGLNLGGLITYSTLQAGVAYAFAQKS